MRLPLSWPALTLSLTLHAGVGAGVWALGGAEGRDAAAGEQVVLVSLVEMADVRPAIAPPRSPAPAPPVKGPVVKDPEPRPAPAPTGPAAGLAEAAVASPGENPAGVPGLPAWPSGGGGGMAGEPGGAGSGVAGTSGSAPPGDGAVLAEAAAEEPFLPARSLHLPRPPYPEQSRRRGEQGTVLLAVTVGEGGAAREVVVLRSSGSSLLDASACEAARGARFSPAREGERAVETVKQVAFTFRLDDAEGEW